MFVCGCVHVRASVCGWVGGWCEGVCMCVRVYMYISVGWISVAMMPYMHKTQNLFSSLLLPPLSE